MSSWRVKSAITPPWRAHQILAFGAGLRLQFLSLQRCFQIGDNALAELLAAAASTRQQLRCVALSHLQLQNWPTGIQGGAAATASEDELPGSPATPTLLSQHIVLAPICHAASSLHMLALHNCNGLSAEGLQAIAIACPQLYMLCLGGSTIQVPKQSRVDSASGSGYIPMLNSIPRSRAATLSGVLRKAPSCHHPSAHSIAVHLSELVLQLPQLLFLEITFLPYGVRSELRSLLASSPCNRLVHVLDLCESKSITAAVEHSSRTSSTAGLSTSATHLKCSKLKSHLALLLEAAAHCSNAVRQTPLHVAVDVDDAGAVEVNTWFLKPSLAPVKSDSLCMSCSNEQATHYFPLLFCCHSAVHVHAAVCHMRKVMHNCIASGQCPCVFGA